MIIPHHRLATSTVDNLIEEFITREGTDYGLVEFCLSEKVAQVKQQLLLGEVCIVFDEVTETVNLISAESYFQSQ